ncbi:MAG: lysine biosynthesis protein LysW [Actinomycetota bacterium]
MPRESAPRTDAPVAAASCPECAAEVAVAGDTLVCEIITCLECTAELEVVALDPVELALTPELEEDWGE